MDTAVISPKFQVVIPKEIRNNLSISPGQRVKFVAFDNHLEMIILKDLRELVGICEGMDNNFEREDEDRL